MILYRTRHPDCVAPPAWLAGARNLHVREDLGGRLHAVGDAYLIGPHDAGWIAVEGDYDARLVGSLDALQLVRDQSWCQAEPVTSLSGTVWLAPVILSATGERAFRCALGGRDFLPRPTPEQQRCWEVAKAAREALRDAVAGTVAMPARASCQWAAILLAAVHHVSVDTLACLDLLDEPLVLQVLRVAAGYATAAAEEAASAGPERLPT